MKMQILDQKCRMSDHELSRFINGFFCTFVTHPSKSVLSVFSSLGSEYHYGHHKTSFLGIQGKNTKYLIYEQDSGYKIFMSKFFFLWVNRALKLDESINNLTIGKFSFQKYSNPSDNFFEKIHLNRFRYLPTYFEEIIIFMLEDII